MSETESAIKLSIPASGDLSAAKYLVAAVDSSGNAIKLVTAGARGIGVILNKPTALGQATEVAISGRVPAMAGAAFNANVELAATTAGKLVTATTAQHVVAVSLEVASGDGSVVDVLWGYRGAAA